LLQSLLHIQKECDTRAAAHIGWSEDGPFLTAFTFLLFGDGETGVLVRKILETAEPNNKHQTSGVNWLTADLSRHSE
jgi:hypothetical protein